MSIRKRKQKSIVKRKYEQPQFLTVHFRDIKTNDEDGKGKTHWKLKIRALIIGRCNDYGRADRRVMWGLVRGLGIISALLKIVARCYL